MEKNKTPKPYYREPLTQAINKYGRERLMEKLDISKGMVNGVCAGYRQFGNKKAKKVASELGIDRSVVRPDIWA